MAGSFARALLVLAASSISVPVAAKGTNPCAPSGCPTDTQQRQTTIKPYDLAEFRTFGDVFEDVATEVNFGNADATPFSLGFLVNFGGGLTDTAFISKNGLLSFGAPLVAYQQTSSLENLNLPVIAPYYAKLAPAANDSRAGVGDVLFQRGSADVYADGGAYSMADLLPAVRITWYGVMPATTGAAGGSPIYAQLVIAGARDGSYSTAQFRYGTDSKGEPGGNSIAGFSLYGTTLQFDGPYNGMLPGFVEYSNGRFIGQGATVADGVPEPSTWAQMILGFGLLGYALRRRAATGQPSRVPAAK